MQEEVITQAPVFTQPMRDIRVAENQAVHFEARLIPVGDPKLKVEWLRNGVSIQACEWQVVWVLGQLCSSSSNDDDVTVSAFVNFNFIFLRWLLIKLQTLLESLDRLFGVCMAK